MKKAQVFSIRHTGLVQPTNIYGKPALIRKPFDVSNALSRFRGTNSCGEMSNQISVSLAKHGANIQNIFQSCMKKKRLSLLCSRLFVTLQSKRNGNKN